MRARKIVCKCVGIHFVCECRRHHARARACASDEYYFVVVVESQVWLHVISIESRLFRCIPVHHNLKRFFLELCEILIWTRRHSVHPRAHHLFTSHARARTHHFQQQFCE